MYVCICNQVTDREIREAVYGGARCLRDIQQELGVANQCGKCGQMAKCILKESLAECDSQFTLQAA
ncbi:MAG: (2Fe-2S)-binding protein [Pseudomonadota bacterium]|nr:(2Fe-2S)-binding protein [Pseudomonadota bacterium]